MNKTNFNAYANDDLMSKIRRIEQIEQMRGRCLDPQWLDLVRKHEATTPLVKLVTWLAGCFYQENQFSKTITITCPSVSHASGLKHFMGQVLGTYFAGKKLEIVDNEGKTGEKAPVVDMRLMPLGNATCWADMNETARQAVADVLTSITYPIQSVMKMVYKIPDDVSDYYKR